MRWSDASAVWQAKNGTPDDPRTVSAWDYITSRMDGYTQYELNTFAEKEEK